MGARCRNIGPMCYSAQVQEAYDEYCDQFSADIDIETFTRLYGMKL